jgi:hypothetical protein
MRNSLMLQQLSMINMLQMLKRKWKIWKYKIRSIFKMEKFYKKKLIIWMMLKLLLLESIGRKLLSEKHFYNGKNKKIVLSKNGKKYSNCLKYFRKLKHLKY